MKRPPPLEYPDSEDTDDLATVDVKTFYCRTIIAMMESCLGIQDVLETCGSMWSMAKKFIRNGRESINPWRFSEQFIISLIL
jgi:hypothetical protein